MTEPVLLATEEQTTPPVEPASGRRERRSWQGAIFLIPAIILLLVLVVYPIVFSAIRSLFNADGSKFIGIGNYTSLFTDPATFTALKNNVIWVVVAPSVVTILGLMFAVLTERIRWATLFKILIFMPMAISFLASGVIFRLVYQQDPNQGVANAIIKSVHDVFAPASSYPGARPREATSFTSKGGTLTAKQSVQTGQSTKIGLLAILPQNVPKAAAPATAPPASVGNSQIAGTVWLDFAFGGGGKSNVIDPNEKGLPGITVNAVQNGRVVAHATTDDHGTFTFNGLSPGSYQMQLPSSNFAEPFAGVIWLSPTLVTWAIIAAYIWIYAGFAMVLLAAGMAAVPRDVMEAARMDGATEWQVFRRVTVPLLAPVLAVVFVTLVINVMKVFDLVYIIAPGSVQPDANVLALQMWRVSFGGGQDQGLGSAIGVFLLLLVVPAMAFNIRRFKREKS
ncbi:MAG: ABC transporter permease subunit [Nocardioidaceae bacterium]